MKRGFSRWLSFFALLSLFVSTKAVGVLAASPVPAVGPDMLQEGGDCLGDEILAWQRLRAERQTVAEEDDSSPIAFVDAAGCVYLVTGSGKLMTSDDGGRNFLPNSDSPHPSTIDIVVEDRHVNDVQAAGVLRSTAPTRLWLGKPRGTVVIAYGVEDKLLMARSDDDGKNWESLGELRVAGYDKLRAGGVRIVQLSNGALLLAVAAWKEAGVGEPEGLVLRSEDEGATWALVGSLGPRCAGASLLERKTGELLAAITFQGGRHEGDPGEDIQRKELFNHVVVARSLDEGKTWNEYQCVTRYKESPADLTELADGTIVLTYGEQNFPYGGRAMVSGDGGRSWASRRYILGFSTVQLIFPHVWSGSSPQLTEPGWRVSSVAWKDGIIVSFYTRGSLVVPVPGADGKEDTGQRIDKGKAVLAVRWTLEGMNKPPMSYPGVKCEPNAEGYLDNGRELIRPGDLNWGGDYFSLDEILVYERLAAEHHVLGPGTSPIMALDPEGNPVVSSGPGQIYRANDKGRDWQHLCDAPLQAWIRAFGMLRDGTMLLAGSNVVLRSEDMGKTWSRVEVPIPVPYDGMGIDEGHHISQLPDGTVLLPIAAGNSKIGIGVWMVYRSRDSGRSWEDWSYRNAYNDVALKSGRILALMRHESVWQPGDCIERLDIPENKARFYLLRCNTLIWSNDNGYTWNHPPRTVTRYNETPGDLAVMSDGTVVTTYHNKNNPIGARAMISRDNGMTWDKTLYMLGWWRFSGGFTSCQVLKDGRIVTADTGWSPGDNINRIEVTTWRPLPVGRSPLTPPTTPVSPASE